MSDKLKIIFAGIPDMALVCLSNLLIKKFDIIGVIPPHKTHETYHFFKNFVQNSNLNLIEFDSSPNEKECIEKIKALNADIGVVCSYNMLFTKEFLNTAKMGYINCHPSLLPYYRGACPYFHIINNGEKYSGITLHFMDEKFDTGDIIYQSKFDILPQETMGTLFNRTTYMLSDALIEVLTKLEKTGKTDRTPQPKNNNFPYASKVDGNFRLRFNTYNVFELERLIRACNPFYSAFATFRGVNMKVIKACAIEKKHNLKFGTIAKADEKNLLISAKGGFLSLEIFQVGTWGVFSPYEFYNIFSPNCDEVLT